MEKIIFQVLDYFFIILSRNSFQALNFQFFKNILKNKTENTAIGNGQVLCGVVMMKGVMKDFYWGFNLFAKFSFFNGRVNFSQNYLSIVSYLN